MVAAGRQFAEAGDFVHLTERTFRRSPLRIQRWNDPEIAGAHSRQQRIGGGAEFRIYVSRVERRGLRDVSVRVDDFESRKRHKGSADCGGATPAVSTRPPPRRPRIAMCGAKKRAGAETTRWTCEASAPATDTGPYFTIAPSPRIPAT